jgi:hypothetical protein
MILQIFIGISIIAMGYSTWRTLVLYKPTTLKELITGEVGSMLMFTLMVYSALITLYCKITGQPVPEYMSLYMGQ